MSSNKGKSEEEDEDNYTPEVFQDWAPTSVFAEAFPDEVQQQAQNFARDTTTRHYPTVVTAAPVTATAIKGSRIDTGLTPLQLCLICAGAGILIGAITILIVK